VSRSDALREKLGALARDRRGGTAPAENAAPAPSRAARRAARANGSASHDQAPVGVEAYLPGGVWQGERGAVFVHERMRSELDRRRSDWGLVIAPTDLPELEPLAQLGLTRALFLDLETGGLQSSPVFLAGTMHWNGEDFVLRQYFARHYGEEAALIEALDRQVRAFDVVITFNGKSYDAPFLTGRALLHGVPLHLPAIHLDLLHLSRRRWKSELSDCRLQTLERHVCRRLRSGDVPGEEVPGLYHDYVRRGDPYRLIPVFHHNLLDVITMGEILRALGAGLRRTPSGLSR
jgi:uncharacterized protein YprB with RNaseH-like and TPR domain